MSFDPIKYAEKCQYADSHGTELSFYSAFESLLESIFPDRKHYHVVNNPSSNKGEGHPDFQVDNDGVAFLRVEAKLPKNPILQWLNNPTCHTEASRLFHQIHKYKQSTGMTILITDFKTIWWVDTEEVSDDETQPIPILYKFILLNSTLMIESSFDSNYIRLKNLLSLDLKTAKTGILELLNFCKPFLVHLRDELNRIQATPIGKNEEALQKHLNEIYSDFKKTLFKDYKEEWRKKFINLYTQLIVYGMFMGWIRFNKSHRSRDEFTIYAVSSYLPNGSLIQNLFSGIRDNITDQIMTSVFIPIQKRFNHTDYSELASKMDDLMNEFYSGFLEKFDPIQKKEMGVIYTPKDVVDFMVRGIDYILTNKFHISNGILNPIVKYLDPAAGTMAFPCSLMQEARRKLNKIDDDDKSSLHTDVDKRMKFSSWFHETFLRKNDSLGNIFGFEVLMAPYILGSLRVLMTAEKLGAKIDYSVDRPQMYLMNTLMDFTNDNNPDQSVVTQFLPNIENAYVKSELREALTVRKKEEIMVILGNPPYNISSQNASKWIIEKVNEYISPENLTREEGKPQIKSITGLKSSKDDYWKFLRFAQWKITENENKEKQGIVAFITNNFYIDGLCARGLRKEYRKAFDEIYIINLHGDWKKKISERAKITSDENIFNVNCGITIIFAIRYPAKEHENHKSKNLYDCLVHYHEVWGTTENKLDYLQNHSLPEIPFIDVDEKMDWEFSPYIQVDLDYNTFPSINDIFLKSAIGVVSGHDDEVISYTKEETELKLIELFSKYSKKIIDEIPPKDDVNKTWKRKRILNTNLEDAKKCIYPYQWRGFDKRFISFDEYLIGRSMFEVMQYLLPEQKNFALIVNRQSGKGVNSSYFISSTIVADKCNENASGLANTIFPMNINTSLEKDDFKKPKSAIYPNINPEFMASLPYWNWSSLKGKDKRRISEDIFFYIYGILYSPSYREDYKGLLTQDYPRIPFPTTQERFQSMSNLGRKLASFHLMTDPNTSDFSRQTTNISTIEGQKQTIKDSTKRFGEITIPTYYIENFHFLLHDDDNEIGDIWFNGITKKGKKEKNENETKKKVYEPDPNALCIKNIPKDVWEFQIGGFRQLEQWMENRRFSKIPKKDHLTRGINQDEVKYLLCIINSITDTLEILPDLDKEYNSIISQIANITPILKKSSQTLDFHCE